MKSTERDAGCKQLRWHMGVVPIGPLRWEGLIEHSTKVLEAAMSNYNSQIKPVADEYTSNHLTCRSSMWLQGLLDLVI